MPEATAPDAILASPLVAGPGGGQATLQVDGRSCSLAEIALVEMWVLRGNAAEPEFAAAVLRHTGLHLPVRANGASIDPQRQLLWLGPDEWMFKARDGQGGAAASALRQELQGIHSAVVEVGDGFTTLAVQGPGAADLLARGCPLDLHPRAFPGGALAQSHVAKANVTILCLHAGSDFEVTVRRSFARYLLGWLREAGD